MPPSHTHLWSLPPSLTRLLPCPKVPHPGTLLLVHQRYLSGSFCPVLRQAFPCYPAHRAVISKSPFLLFFCFLQNNHENFFLFDCLWYNFVEHWTLPTRLYLTTARHTTLTK